MKHSWTFNYTSHLGYSPPELRPQFLHSAGEGDLVKHVHHAAELGMAGVLYPWAIERPRGEVEAVAAAVRERGLRSSAVIATPMEVLASGIWTRTGASDRRRLEDCVRQAARTAVSLGSDLLAAIVINHNDAGAPEPARQREAALQNIRSMADIAGHEGLRLGIEPMNRLPNVLIASMRDGVDFVQEVDRADVGLVFDTGHVSQTDGDLLGALDAAYGHVQLVQIVDQPGRVEPGAGNLNLVELGAQLVRLGYSGLVDLEHGWSSPGSQGEVDGLERIRRFDEAVHDAALNQETD